MSEAIARAEAASARMQEQVSVALGRLRTELEAAQAELAQLDAEAAGAVAGDAPEDTAPEAPPHAPEQDTTGPAAPSGETEEMLRLRAELAEANAALLEAREELRLMWKGINPRALRTRPGASGDAPAGVGEVAAFDEKGHKKRMGEILVEAGFLTEEELNDLLGEQAQDPHLRFGALAVRRGITTEEIVATILAAQLRLPFVALEAAPPDPDAIGHAPMHLARLHRCIPWRLHEDRLLLAMENPLDLIAIEDIELSARMRVEPVVATASAISAALDAANG